MEKREWIIFRISIVLLLVTSFTNITKGICVAEDKMEPAKYKLRADVDTFYKEKDGEGDTDISYSAAAGSTLYIITDTNNKKGKIVKFKKVRTLACKKTGTASPCPDKEMVNDDEFFVFYLDNSNNPSLKTLGRHYLRKSFGIEHGLLIIPFKYRTNDGTLSGESTIGYYAGIGTEWLLGTGTIFLSAGMSRIAINDVDQDVEQRTGVTAAAGIVLTGKNNFQIAFVSGLDHLGGNTGRDWEYEDDVWISFAIGYNFAVKK